MDNLSKQFHTLLEQNRSFVITTTPQGIAFSPKTSLSKEEAKINCAKLYHYLLETIRPLALDALTQEEFSTLRGFVDDYYIYIREVASKYRLSSKEKEELRIASISLKLGGNIPIEWLVNNEIFLRWIKNNRLQHIFFAFRQKLLFDPILGPILPFQLENRGTKLIPWKRILIKAVHHHHHLVHTFSHNEILLFETNAHYKFVPGYTALHKGILAYDIYKDSRWLPHDFQDPREWNYEHVLEVWTVCLTTPKDNPSLFRNTHGYILLKDSKGNVRSTGQDILMHIKDVQVTEVLSRKPGYGKIMTPDNYVYCPLSLRQFKKVSIRITKEAHDKLIATVEKDKGNKDHSMSVMRGNCVSYVVKLLKVGPEISIDASMHGMHIFLKALLPSPIYRFFYTRFDPWYNKRSQFVQRALFFFPPFYFLYLFFGLIAYLLNQNSYQNRKDFSFKDILLRPWRMTVDPPLQLHRRLEKLASNPLHEATIYPKNPIN